MKSATILLFCLLLVGCSPRNPVEDAKAVVTAHENFVASENLDGILSNTADDIVVLVPAMPLIKGKQAVRDFYSGMFKAGKSQFIHEYQGSDVVGDAAVLYGTAKGSLTKPDSTTAQFANNFILTFRYQPDGKIKFWRVAFAPSSQ
jgi:ketosteroid isomerase-like protein